MLKRINLHKVAAMASFLSDFRFWLSLLLLISCNCMPEISLAQSLRERLQQRRQHSQQASAQTTAAQVQELAYGPDARQKLDIYRPPASTAQLAPVIVMVHGGGWRIGDKRHAAVVENKLHHWRPQGVMLVSLNYRMLPEAKPDQQVADIALALAWLQRELPALGGDPNRLLLMGHSAGAHLISLLSASSALQQQYQLRSWRLSIALDSAAYDVTAIMQRRHPALYDDAFGTQLSYWQAMSPLQQLQHAMPPFIAVCSSQRRDGACQQAQAFVDKARQQGGKAETLPVNLSHGEINRELGSPGAYTQALDALLNQLIGAL